jgi:hypothetical protein
LIYDLKGKNLRSLKSKNQAIKWDILPLDENEDLIKEIKLGEK